MAPLISRLELSAEIPARLFELVFDGTNAEAASLCDLGLSESVEVVGPDQRIVIVRQLEQGLGDGLQCGAVSNGVEGGGLGVAPKRSGLAQALLALAASQKSDASQEVRAKPASAALGVAGAAAFEPAEQTVLNEILGVLGLEGATGEALKECGMPFEVRRLRHPRSPESTLRNLFPFAPKPWELAWGAGRGILVLFSILEFEEAEQGAAAPVALILCQKKGSRA